MPPMGNFAFGTELIYSFVIILCSLLIYFATKEIYELSSHKGLKYFRNSFLFFALAYFSRYSIKFILTFFYDQRIIMHSNIILLSTLFFYILFNTMAIFYLLYSVVWKKINFKYSEITIYLISLFLSLLILITNNSLIYLSISLTLLILAAYIFLSWGKKSKLNLYGIYLSLLAFLALNVIDILVPNFLKDIQILIYVFSISLFIGILYKVTKNIGNN